MGLGWKQCVMAVMLLAAPTIASAQSAETPPTIEWRVKDRFRLWDQATDGPRAVSLETVLTNVAAAGNPKAVEEAMLAFLASQPNLHRRAYWREGDETYDRDFLWPQNYSVVLVAKGLDGQTCTWSVDDRDLGEARPCSEPVEHTLDAIHDQRADGVRLGSRLSRFRVNASSGQRIEAEVQVRDRLIASIGDSYASGEGNPDRPMDVGRLPTRFDEWEDAWDGRWVGREAVVQGVGGTEWWDRRCHRSFLSQHMVAAVRFAAANPQIATTFVTFACSGAQTFAGVLATQTQPPGFGDADGDSELNYPQVEVLVANMCPRPPNGRSRDSTTYVRQAEPYWNGTYATRWRCTGTRQPRAIDALLVSIGGNDIGFGPVIQDALLPDPDQPNLIEGWALDVLRRGTQTPEQAKRQIESTDRREAPLPQNLAAIRTRLRDILPPGAPVLQSVYPNPLNDERGEFCGPDEGRVGRGGVHATALTSVGAFWPRLVTIPTQYWRSVITRAEVDAIQTNLVTPLNDAIRDHVRAGGDQWQVVDAFEPAFRTRGWCAISPGGDLQELALPNWRQAGADRGEWLDWAPQLWDPYTSRQRLFRTPNDAALTQQPTARNRFGFPGWLFGRRLTPRQGAVLAAMSGAFHPTFEAHAIIGWSLGEALIATPLPE